MTAKRRKSPRQSHGKRDQRRKRSIPPLFLDEAVASKKLAAALRGMGFKVHLLTDHYAKGTDDPTWLREVGRRGWLVITRDREIRENEFELLAVQQAKVRLFVLRMKGCGVDAWAVALKKAQRRVVKILETTRAPFVVHITASGQTNLVWPPVNANARRTLGHPRR